MKKNVAAILALALIALSLSWAQTLSPSSLAPAQDGAFGEGEYTLKADRGPMRLGLSLSKDGKTLYCAVDAPTAGWVAIGLGSAAMNGAYFVMGADAGKPEITEQRGFGFSHKPAGPAQVLKSAVKAAGGRTVLEFSIPASPFVKGGKLDLCLAFGATPDFQSRHASRTTFSTAVGN